MEQQDDEPSEGASPERFLPPARVRVRKPPIDPDIAPTPASEPTAQGAELSNNPSSKVETELPAAPRSPVPQEPKAPRLNPDGSRVGFGNPPQETRWKPKQSGNPKGRRNGSKNVKTMWLERLTEPVTGKVDGKRIKETVFEHIIRGRVIDAARRDHKAITHVFAEVARLGLFQDPPDDGAPARAGAISETDQQIYDRILARASVSSSSQEEE